MERAASHSIEINRPAPDFFAGALLGNGGMGVVVTTRPDAVWLHFGHNNVWDIRISEKHQDKFGTFDEIFRKACQIPDSLPSIYHDREMADYLSLTADNYRSPYPRPFPCGSVVLGFDRRKVELLGHRLDTSNGMCEVNFLVDGRHAVLRLFTDMESDNLWGALYDGHGNPIPSIFNRIRVMPDPSTPGDIERWKELPLGGNALGFFQRLPYSTESPETAKDKAFALEVATSDRMLNGERTTTLGVRTPLEPMERYLDGGGAPFVMHAVLYEGSVKSVETAIETAPSASMPELVSSMTKADEIWRGYWSKSGVELADKELEKIWYRNLYFLNCAMKPGVTPPGIFGNWSYGNIGTSWHGDYHLNYNTQQPYWVTFSSNHLDKNLVYADLVDNLLPVSKKWANDYYGMRGAFFPHSAYPVEMHTHPYPVPDWGWEVFETPWMVQGLWWHYIYSGDTGFLRNRAFGPMKEAVMFLADYMTRPDAHGSERWDDSLYHIFPSVPPELYGLQPGFKFNYDTQIDLALTRFLFDAYLQSVDILGLKKQERELAGQVRTILASMPEYSTFESPEYGRIFTSVPGEKDEIVFNVPASLSVVFPGEQYGLSSPDSIRQTIANTIAVHQNEGGNEIVFLPLQKARMGMLDLEAFKRQVNYATLPGGTVTDAVLQTGGRYADGADYMYMAPMGIWIENFALPAVINECLMQGYDGVIRLFPNWDRAHSGDASFSTLRSRGGFLVSGAMQDGVIRPFTVESTVGGVCRFVNPWDGVRPEVEGVACVKCRDAVGDVWEFRSEPGRTYTVRPCR